MTKRNGATKVEELCENRKNFLPYELRYIIVRIPERVLADGYSYNGEIYDSAKLSVVCQIVEYYSMTLLRQNHH